MQNEILQGRRGEYEDFSVTSAHCGNCGDGLDRFGVLGPLSRMIFNRICHNDEFPLWAKRLYLNFASCPKDDDLFFVTIPALTGLSSQLPRRPSVLSLFLHQGILRWETLFILDAAWHYKNEFCLENIYRSWYHKKYGVSLKVIELSEFSDSITQF